MERTKRSKGKPATPTSNENRSLLTAGIWDNLLKQEYSHDCIILYLFYRRIAIEKKTYLFWANRGYCIKGSKLSRDRFDRAKEVLVRLKLIELVPQIRKDGKFSTVKIKLNYMWEDIDNIENNGETEYPTIKGKAPRITKNRTRPNNGRTYRITDSRITETRNTNSLKEYSFSKNTINTTQKLIFKTFLTESSEGLPKEWKESTPLVSTLHDWFKHLEEKGKICTPSLIIGVVKYLVKNYYSKDHPSPEQVINNIYYSIRNGWSSIFPEPVSKDKNKEDSKKIADPNLPASVELKGEGYTRHIIPHPKYPDTCIHGRAFEDGCESCEWGTDKDEVINHGTDEGIAMSLKRK